MEKISIPENLFAVGAGQIRSLSAVVCMCGFFSVLHLSARPSFSWGYMFTKYVSVIQDSGHTRHMEIMAVSRLCFL